MDALEKSDTNQALLKVNSQWLHFLKPHRIVETKEIKDVLPALRQVEELVETNGWYAAGFLSYEAASAFDPALRTHESGQDFPYLWFGLYPEPQIITLPKPAQPRPALNWLPLIDRNTYHAAIAAIKDQIAEGQTYQVNYTMRLQTDFQGDAWDFFLHLAQNQNDHAAYVHAGRYVICSASPELFFQLENNVITCRPMKGTAPRGRTTAEDRTQAEWLRASAKNRAENVMIVDMIRNDLGRISEVGSVSVPRLFEMERYPTLWQMTSTVSARTNAPLAEILSALFPCASITGAPKVSTMRIISDLEISPRHIYTGAIGTIAPQRKANFNVAIRTVLIDRQQQKAEYGIGGGVVWDSSSADEYEEALLKARLLTQPIPSFSLLETMLWTPEAGFFLYEKHIARMLDSAGYFDIPVTKENLEGYLEQISSRFRTAQRVRLLLHQGGTLEVDASAFESSRDDQPPRVGMARQPIDSSNIFLFHKTTRREVYESARRGLEGLDDVLLYNEKGELTEFTIGNLVMEREHQFTTPPVSCGVLAGTFRAHLLESGQIVEGPISIQELSQCTNIFRINSIRGWQKVEIENR